jgi:hypothetical protein
VAIPKMLDLCSGRLGWAKAFLARGWECTGVDLVAPPEIPPGFTFKLDNILNYQPHHLRHFDFVCASTPCEQFSVHGMKHFHPNPPYPELGIKLFNHARAICEASGVPYVMENVRAAQQFVGNAVHHCGPFYLWGSGVPPLMPQGIKKGMDLGSTTIQILSIEERRIRRKQFAMLSSSSGSPQRKAQTANVATIPPELSATVADYAQRLVFDFGEVR